MADASSTDPRIREIDAPVGGEDLAPLAASCQVVQFSAPLGDADYRRVAALLESRPEVKLRAYGDYGRGFRDLEFLQFFPRQRAVQIDLPHLENVDGFRHLPEDLAFLAWGATRSRAFSLRVLGRFRKLRALALEGHAKDIEAVAALTHLQRLSVRALSLPDLAAFVPLRGLRRLDIRLGSVKRLDLLPQFGALEYLELWLVRGVADLAMLAETTALRGLHLQTLTKVAALPALDALGRLTRVHLETMKSLIDLAPVARAPKLEELLLIDMRHLGAEALVPFRGHPTLKAMVAGLGSARKNEAVRRMFPGMPHPLPPRFEPPLGEAAP